MTDIRAIEDKAQKELEEQRKKGQVSYLYFFFTLHDIFRFVVCTVKQNKAINLHDHINNVESA